MRPIRTHRSSLAATSGPDGRIYAIGGANRRGAPVEKSDRPSIDGRALEPAATLTRVSTSSEGSRSRVTRPVRGEAYDTDADRWSEVEPVPGQRFQLTATAGLDGAIFAIGGFLGDRVAGEVDVYMPR